MNRIIYYWLCGLLGILGTFIIFLPNPTIAQTSPLEINIVAGNEVGDYYAVAKNLEEFAAQNDLDIDVIPSQGSLQNIHDVFYYESIPLGIAQSDVLAFLNIFGNGDEEIRRQAEAVKTVYPLYKEEIHLIARKEINSIEELSGKRVAIGELGSGTNTTAATILRDLGISPEELLTFESKKAIDALRDSEIDALFYVIDVPAKVLQEEISLADNLHLLAISLPITADDEFYRSLYEPVTLAAGSYEWQAEPVETLAVQSVLFTVAEQDCESVTQVAQLIKNNLSWFKENGASVWQGVNLEGSSIPEERRSSCSGL